MVMILFNSRKKCETTINHARSKKFNVFWEFTTLNDVTQELLAQLCRTFLNLYFKYYCLLSIYGI